LIRAAASARTFDGYCNRLKENNMYPKELEDLRNRFSHESDNELLKMVNVDFKQYRDEAIRLARAELEKRGLLQAEVHQDTTPEMSTVSDHARSMAQQSQKLLEPPLIDSNDERSLSQAKGADLQTSPDSNVTSKLLKRYKDAYRVSRLTVGFGTLIKLIGVIAAIAIVITTIIVAGNLFNGRETQQAIIGALGVLLAAGFGAIIFAQGLLVSAQGQILKASLDSAVNSSTFLTNAHRAKIMSL
jgi:hypothetical protein